MSVSIAMPMFLQFLNPNNSGSPAAGFQLFTYEAGTTTKQATWTDSTETVQNANPLVLDSNGRAVVWGDPTLAYKFVIAPPNDTDPPSSPTWTTDNLEFPITAASIDGFITQSLIGTTLWPRTAAEISSGITPSNYAYPFGDMRRYGIVSNVIGQTVMDNSAVVQSVYGMMATVGGTMLFQPGDYSFYWDASGIGHSQVYVEGQGCTFRPYSSTPTNSCVVYANNSGTAYSDTYVRFRNVNFSACLFSAQTTPVVNYCVYHNYACSRFYNCHLSYAKVANFYSMFGQYGEFLDCRLDVASFSASSAGCILDSNSLAASTNEVNFHRCEFFSNSIGIWLKGAQKTRLLNCTIQGNSINGILLDADSTSSQTGGTDLIGCWWELNAGSCIAETLAFNTNVLDGMFWATGGDTPTITFAHCSGVSFIGNQFPGGGSVTINHPSGNTDCASIIWRGNMHGTVGDVIPTLNIAHPGTYSLDLHWSGSFTGTLTGCTTSPTATFNYSVNGDCVDLRLPAAGLSGTSNSTACTVTGLPSAISPAGNVYGMIPFLQDNSAAISGQCSIAANGTTLVLYKNNSTSGFTSSGSKGIDVGANFHYPLYT